MTTETRTETETAPETYSHIARPQDRRCQWWQKVCTVADVQAARLDGITGARDLPGTYARAGADFELPIGSVVFDGEANHHRNQRGWTFVMGIVLPVKGGALDILWISPSMERKQVIKADNPELARQGSGDHAALLRMAKWILAGESKAEKCRRYNALKAA